MLTYCGYIVEQSNEGYIVYEAYSPSRPQGERLEFVDINEAKAHIENLIFEKIAKEDKE